MPDSDLPAVVRQVEEALAAATPGPWEVGVTYNAARNAHLIANAPTWLRTLLDALSAAEGERDAAQSSEDLARSMGRDLILLGYSIGKWTENVIHAEPCDCDEDEESVGDTCMAQSSSRWALLRDEGAHGWSLAGYLSGDDRLGDDDDEDATDERVENVAAENVALRHRLAAAERREGELREALRRANDVLRSTHQIAAREQDAPNSTAWANFQVRVDEVLAEQHRIMYPPAAPAEPTEKEGGEG